MFLRFGRKQALQLSLLNHKTFRNRLHSSDIQVREIN